MSFTNQKLILMKKYGLKFTYHQSMHACVGIVFGIGSLNKDNQYLNSKYKLLMIVFVFVFCFSNHNSWPFGETIV